MVADLIARAKIQLKKELPFVLYSKPKEAVLNAVFQADNTLHEVVDYTEQGFVFAPFLDRKSPVLLKADEVSKVTFEVPLQQATAPIQEVSSNPDEEQRYIELVQKAILEIQSGNCKKIVLSRTIHVSLDKPIFVVFKELLNTYSNAFCYLWYHPKVGLWLGATPEILVKTSGLNFTTMSLAGTQNKEAGQERPDWSSKELREQQYVTDYIAGILAHRATDVLVNDVETISAGHLWHLRSKITGRFYKGMFKDLITALHPTPAVCGLPLGGSRRFILENENYQRTYYTGFLGELNFKKETARNRNRKNQENSAYRSVVTTSELFVNLRCMQKVKDSVIIYVGGGITADSEPRSEWSETESKAQTMLRLLAT
ncbi:chorismate-binding protein [Maribacter chungangensis]|uniref:Chorismate-binding protein n=1 Tax=Maribacter chungangensis TaxID=1069117 RepID=A0ABW3B3R6_9FLAO